MARIPLAPRRLPLLPLEYALTAMLRRPARSAAIAIALALTAALLAGAAAFARGLERSFTRLGRDDVAIVLATSSEGDPLRSEIAFAGIHELAAQARGVRRTRDEPLISPEIVVGLDVALEREAGAPHAALLRGVEDAAYLLHPEVTVVAGNAPRGDEVLVGRLAARRLGANRDSLAIGAALEIDGRRLVVAGEFTAPGTALEGEIWVPLQTLLTATRRETVSLAFVALDRPGDLAEVELFCARRRDLELVVASTAAHYATFAALLAPLTRLALGMAALVALAALLVAATSVAASVRERRAEIASLAAIGYPRAAIAHALLVEALTLGALAALAGLVLAAIFLDGAAVAIAMGAVEIQLDAEAVTFALLLTPGLAALAVLPPLSSSLAQPVSLALRRD
jgi:putative ABC transport system permease protein